MRTIHKSKMSRRAYRRALVRTRNLLTIILWLTFPSFLIIPFFELTAFRFVVGVALLLISFFIFLLRSSIKAELRLMIAEETGDYPWWYAPNTPWWMGGL